MKLTVSQSQLAHGLGMVSRAVSARSTLPVLGNVLLASDEGRLRLAATNLEMGISCWIGARIEDEGSITVPARLLADLVNTLPGDQVTLSVNINTQTLNVRSGSSNTDIKGISSDEFPPISTADPGEGIQQKTSDFREMIQQVSFAASTDEARPVLQGVQLQINGAVVSMAATDGFRISMRKLDLPAGVESPVNLIIPARALNEVARMASEEDETISIIVPKNRGQAVFHYKNSELVSQLIDGNFPDYRVVLPKTFKNQTIVNTEAFLKAVRQAEIIARNGNNVVRLNLQKNEDRPGRVQVSSQTEETGSNETSIEANIDGPDLTVALNVRYLRDALEVLRTPNMVLQLNDHKSPVQIQAPGDESFVHVIMPMHIG